MRRSLFDDLHEDFRASFRTFLEREVIGEEGRYGEWERAGIVPREVFALAGAGGFLGMAVPETYGGAGADDFRLNLVIGEEVQRAGVGSVGLGMSVHTDICVPYFLSYCTEPQRQRWLDGIATGELIAAIAMTEPGIGSDLAAMSTTAKREGDHYVVNGSKTFITNGTRADFITMLVKTAPEKGAHGCSFFLVPTKTPGFHVAKKLKKIGNKSSDTAELFLEDVRVPRRYMLGEENMGFMYLMQNFQTERLIASVGGVAGSFLTLEHTINYGRERVAFGKPIIKREVWQHKFVDLYTKLEAAKAFAYRCVDAYNEERYVQKGPISLETVKLISMAKILVGDLVSEIADECLQFHGGWGYIEDFPIARIWRDQRLLRIGGGTTETMKYYLAKLMGF